MATRRSPAAEYARVSPLGVAQCPSRDSRLADVVRAMTLFVPERGIDTVSTNLAAGGRGPLPPLQRLASGRVPL
jgi:hypothetical protein